MMFEPLMDMLRIHGDKFHDRLCEIRDSLAGIAQNTEAQVARNQWANKSIETAKEATEQLRNNSAYGWLIRDVAVTTESEIFLNVASGEGFVCKLKGGERENVRWYVPPGSVVFVKNLSAGAGFTNIQVEILVTSAAPANTGSSGEYLDIPKDPTTPSGHPLTL